MNIGTDIALELERCGATEVFLAHNAGRRGGKFAGTIQEVANIKSLSSDGTVHLMDGKKIRNVDDVLLCTGFVYDLSFLHPSSGLSVEADGRYVKGLVSHCIAKKKPTLSMIGVPYNVLPFPMFEDQALFHAAVLSGRVSAAALDKLYELELAEEKQLAHPRKYRHKLMDRQWEYRRRMADLAGFSTPSLARTEIYNDSRAARRRDIRNYRGRVYKMFGEGSGDWVVHEEGEEVSGKYDFDASYVTAPMHP